jgi:ATP-dependent DNA helicase RecG
MDRKSFEFDLLTNIDEALIFVERHLNLAYEIRELRRKEILEIPEFVLREAIINAVAHRDYFERGANVQIDIFDNRVEISNPGGLAKGLKPENFGKHSVTRNALIASLLHRCNYVERAGTGIQRMREGMKEASLLEPTFEFSGFFTVILQRNKVVEKKPKVELKVSAERMQRMITIVKNLRDGVVLDIASLSEQFDTTDRTIRRDLEMLERYGWIKSVGATRNTQYSLTAEGLKRLNDSD